MSELILLTTQQAADFIGVPASTLEQYRYQNRGPGYIKFGKHVKYEPEELKRWLYQHYKFTSESGDIPFHVRKYQEMRKPENAGI